MTVNRSLTWLFALLLSSTFMSAQTSEGRILGTVVDRSGAVVNAARVTITSTATNLARQFVTTGTGEYVAPNLEPGRYVVTVEAAGFKRGVSTNVVLEVSRDVRVDFRLEPGSVSQTVEVSAEGAIADTTNSTLNGVLPNKAVEELPVQGRDFQNLLELHPGVQRTPGGGFHSVTSNGSRLEDMNYIVDGVDDNDAYYGDTVINGAGVLGTPASHLPLDAIQEFNTEENQSAEFGWKPGAVVNIGVRSGTNQFHGTAYYFNRNSALDARN